MFAPSLCPFAPFTTITLCFVTFFWALFFISCDVYCSLRSLQLFFFFSYVYHAPCSSLLFCYCSCSNGAHNTSIVLHLVVMFNMVICLNLHLLCFVHFIMTLQLHNGFCLCCLSHSFVALITYCFFMGSFFCVWFFFLFQRTHNGSFLYFIPHVIIIIIFGLCLICFLLHCASVFHLLYGVVLP